MKDVVEYDAIIVVTPKDFERTLPLHERMARFLPVSNIYVLGAEEIKDIIALEGNDKFKFINENAVVPFDDVYNVVCEHMHEAYPGADVPRATVGWYYQQILKYEYHRFSDNKYYLTWDGDTVPCKAFSMFAENHTTPYFDMKNEYNIDYFETLNKLLPGYGKCVEKSFISEHMLFDVDIVRELIEEIEKNENIVGDTWWKKMINSINPRKYSDGVFSEFETYGSYVAVNKPEAYKLRTWNSFRYAGHFLDPNNITKRDWDWLSKDFYALSFEKKHSIREDHRNIFNNPRYQSKLSARQVLEIVQEEMTSGYIETWD